MWVSRKFMYLVKSMRISLRDPCIIPSFDHPVVY